jgi:hypothetical protein
MTPTEDIKAFVVEYLGTANEALTDPEQLQPWRDMFRGTCDVCVAGYESASAVHRDGEAVVGGKLLDTSISVETAAGRRGTVVVTGRVERAQVTDRDGDVIRTYDEIDPVTIIYSVARQSSGPWMVTTGQVVQ